MKPGLFTTRLLPLAGTTVAIMQFSMTSASAATYYWDGKDMAVPVPEPRAALLGGLGLLALLRRRRS
jgi:MYXO-CTERM domain-containing protein